MSLNDLFGSYPGRPDHPDFARLSEIILQADGRSYDEDFDYEPYIAQFIDPASLRHMARERSRRLAASLPSNLTMDALVTALSAVYLDAFVAGYAFHERKANDAPLPPKD